MVTRYRLLVVSVAVVAVVAVAVGGLLATRVSPSSQGASAVPLSGPAPTASVPAPSGSESASTARKSPPPTALNAPNLPVGAKPQLTYLRARTVHSSIGGSITVPGKAELVQIGRVWDTTFTIQRQPDNSTALVVLDTEAREVDRIAGVDSLVTSVDGQSAAYAAGNVTAWLPGGKLYFQGAGSKPAATLTRKDGYGLEVLRVVDRRVYFTAATTSEAQPTLYRWDVGGQVAQLGKAIEPTAVSPDGSQMAAMVVHTDSGTCTAMTDTASGVQRWVTCERQITGFSPTGAFALGTPSGDWPFGPNQLSPLDTKTGKPLRSWTAPAIADARAEDDDHVLLAWHDRADRASRSTIVRCTISTGACEQTLPLSAEPLLLGS